MQGRFCTFHYIGRVKVFLHMNPILIVARLLLRVGARAHAHE